MKLVKRGTGDLTLAGASTFTGGTEIQRGRLIAADTGALGSGEVFVSSDCAQPFSNKDTSALSALSVACATFTNDIRFSAWTATRPTYQAYGFANYNLQAYCETGAVDFHGTVTGGSLSFNNGKERAISSRANYTQATTVNFQGRIDLSGTVYLLDAATVNFRERVACALVTSPNYWCHSLNVWPKANAISAFELGCTALVLNGRDAISGSVVSGWTGFEDQWHQTFDSVDCKGFTQAIDRFVSTDEDWTRAAAFPLRWRSSTAGMAPQVVMRATADSRCDWRFENDVSLVWFPTGDFRMTCAADRASPTTGSIVVSNGTFEVIGATTFSNAAEIVVSDGATFEMNGTAAGAFRSVTRVTVGKGATFKMGLTEAYTTADLVLDLASDATVVIPDEAVFDVGAILVDGEGLPLGKAYTGGADVPGAEKIPQLRGSGKMSPLAAPPRETVAATWTGAAGTTDLEASANWSATVDGLFQSGTIDATFATGGTAAVPTRDALFNLITFTGGVTPFALGASGGTAEVGLGTGGLTASAATAVTTVYAPIGIYGSQTWDVGAGHVLSLTGGVRQVTAKPTTVTKSGTGPLTLYGSGDAGTFAGNFAVNGALEAHGDDPFGRAVAGVDGTVKIVGANKDYAVKFGDCRITKPVRVTGTFADGTGGAGYFGVLDKCTAEFAGSVDIGAGVNFRLEQFNAKVVFSGGGTFAGTFRGYAGDITVTNTPMTISFKDTPCGTSILRFGVSGNMVDAITPSIYAQSVEFHADDAFAGNETELLAWFHWGNNTYYGSTINLNGHSQHVGTFRSRVVPPTAATKSPFAYTPTANSRITSATPATLFVNQLADGVTIVPFMGQAALSKGGPATLVSSNTTHTAAAALAVTGGTLELFDAAWPNATGVTVDATAGLDATLRLTVGPDARETIFPKRIPIALVDGAESVAKIEIPSGVQLRAKNLTVNGHVRSGVWGSSESGAPNVDDVHFAGKGTVFGTGGGMTLILR